MSNKPEIKEIKKEMRGFLNMEHRSTSKDEKGRIGVSSWKKTEAEATQESRERLSDPPKKK